MKTPDVSSKQVQSQQSASNSKTEKPKSSKQFKDVLQETKPKQTRLTGKEKHFPPLEKKSYKSTTDAKPTLAHKGIQQKNDQELKLHSRIEPKEERESGVLQKKHSKEEAQDLMNPQITANLAPQASQIQGPKEVTSTQQNPGLNISEIESIVKQVQVGVNEKGMPEMNFELHTANLGDLSLKVNSDNDKISIQFVTQDAAAQDTLNQNLKELTQILHNKGLNIGELNVRTRDDESQQRQQQKRDDQNDSGFSQ
jgi:flagellar hook-length control protein FliK